MRTVLVNIDYAYYLSTLKIYMILITSDFKLLNTVNTNSKFILTSDNYLYDIGDKIEIYDQNLILIKTIKLPNIASAVWNIFDTLYIQINNQIHLFQPLAPIIQSFIDTIEFENCTLCPSKSSTLILCNDSYTVFTYYCENICHDAFNINFTLINPDKVLLGEYNLVINGTFEGVNSKIAVESNLDVMLYSFEIFFDDSDLVVKPFIHYYDDSLFFSLDGKFRGYNIACELYMNGSLIEDEDFPVTVYTGVSTQTIVEDDYDFLDYDIIKENDLIMVLTNTSILVFESQVASEKSSFDGAKLVYTISKSDYMNSSEDCFSIDYISTIGKSSLFILNCSQTRDLPIYSKGKFYTYTDYDSFVIFIEIDVHYRRINNLNRFYINHEINWIQVVTSSSTHFLVLFIDYTKRTQFNQIYNNNLFVYKGTWNDSIEFELVKAINSNSLSLSKLLIDSADGVYIHSSSNTLNEKIIIYLSDRHYGIRVVSIINNELIIQGGKSYDEETIFSMGICGPTLFVFTNLTSIHSYIITKLFDLTFSKSYEPFYDSNMDWSGSVITCSEYYRPRYLSVFLRYPSVKKYQLRIIDLLTTQFSSNLKFVDYFYDSDAYYKPKSRFLNKYTLISLGVSNSELMIFNISIPSLTINSLNNSEYKNLIQKYNSDTFNLQIHYFNSHSSNYSNEFSVVIKKSNNGSNSSTSSISIILVVGVCAIILILIALSSFFAYKKYIGRKSKSRNIESQSIIDTFQIHKGGRLGLLINHEESSSSIN